MAFGYGEGFKDARRRAAVRLKKSISQAAMADLITVELRRMGVDKTVSQSAVSDYEAEISEPSLVVIRAAARIGGMSEAEVAGLQASVNIDASQLRYLTEEEIGRAQKKVAEDPTLSARVTGKGARKRRA